MAINWGSLFKAAGTVARNVAPFVPLAVTGANYAIGRKATKEATRRSVEGQQEIQRLLTENRNITADLTKPWVEEGGRAVRDLGRLTRTEAEGGYSPGEYAEIIEQLAPSDYIVGRGRDEFTKRYSSRSRGAGGVPDPSTGDRNPRYDEAFHSWLADRELRPSTMQHQNLLATLAGYGGEGNRLLTSQSGIYPQVAAAGNIGDLYGGRAAGVGALGANALQDIASSYFPDEQTSAMTAYLRSLTG